MSQPETVRRHPRDLLRGALRIGSDSSSPNSPVGDLPRTVGWLLPRELANRTVDA